MCGRLSPHVGGERPRLTSFHCRKRIPAPKPQRILKANLGKKNANQMKNQTFNILAVLIGALCLGQRRDLCFASGPYLS
jgi:hypothetical protein